MFVLVVFPGFSLVQTMMTDYRVTNPLVEASLRDGLIRFWPLCGLKRIHEEFSIFPHILGDLPFVQLSPTQGCISKVEPI